MVSIVSVPFQIKNEKVIAVLNCFTAELYPFSETEVNLVQIVANQAAVAIANTELMVKNHRVIQKELETQKFVERAKEILILK